MSLRIPPCPVIILEKAGIPPASAWSCALSGENCRILLPICRSAQCRFPPPPVLFFLRTSPSVFGYAPTGHLCSYSSAESKLLCLSGTPYPCSPQYQSTTIAFSSMPVPPQTIRTSFSCSGRYPTARRARSLHSSAIRFFFSSGKVFNGMYSPLLHTITRAVSFFLIRITSPLSSYVLRIVRYAGFPG